MTDDDNNFQVYCSPGILDFLAEVLEPIEEGPAQEDN